MVSGILLFCILGIQLVGVVHEIKHDSYLKSLNSGTSQVDVQDSFGHDSGSNPCKLLNGFALSAFLVSIYFALQLFNQFTDQFRIQKPKFVSQALNCFYSSRAPPKSVF
jgi:hypothetical protein